MGERTKAILGGLALVAALTISLVAVHGQGPRQTVLELASSVVAITVALMFDRWWRETGELGWRTLAWALCWFAVLEVVIGVCRLAPTQGADVAAMRLLLVPGLVAVAVAGVQLAALGTTTPRWHLVAELLLLATANSLLVWLLLGRPATPTGTERIVLLVAGAHIVAAAGVTSAWLRRGGVRLACGTAVCLCAVTTEVLGTSVQPRLGRLHLTLFVGCVVVVLTLAVADRLGLARRPHGLGMGARLALVLGPVALTTLVSTVALLRRTRIDGVSLVLGGATALALLANQIGYHLENRSLLQRLRARMRDEALAASRSRALLDGLVEAVVVIDAAGRVVEVNEPFTVLTGWTADEMRGADGLSIAAPGDRSFALAELEALRAEPAAAGTTEMRIVRRDGTELWVDASARNLLDEPSLAALVVTLRDISERRVAEQQLADARQLFRTAFEGAPIGMVLATPDGALVEVNGAFERMLGYASGELEGRTIDGLLALPGRGDPTAELRERFASRGMWTTDVVFDDATGRRVVTSTSGRRIDSDPAGALVVCQIQDVTAARHTADQLAWSASHDALTGLPNRTELLAATGVALAAARETTVVGMLFIDLDRFKLVNDSLGHGAGDELLQVVARRLAAVVRSSDLVARLGGDEFAVLVNAESEAGVVAVADRVHSCVAEPILLADGDLFVTASVGMAIAEPDDDAGSLLRDADTAMYRAKDRGRDRIERFEADTRRRVVATLQTSTDLHRALERNELVVHYQPIVDIHDRSIRGVEALVRWQHPERGMVSPVEFIPMAEDTGLIVPVGERVLDIAAADLARWQATPGWESLSVNVNLSPRQMAAPGVAEMFQRVIDRHGIDPDGLWVEITESALMADVRVATVILRAMRAMGLHVAVDDFGTGYSSLTYLTRFPVECLKIDRSFVSALGTDAGAAAIVDAVAGLGRTMGLTVVSEGIETEEQAEHLRRMDCRFGQGYLYSRPVPAVEIDAMLTHARAADRHSVHA